MKPFLKFISAICLLCMLLPHTVSASSSFSDEDEALFEKIFEQVTEESAVDTRLNAFYTAIGSSPAVHYVYESHNETMGTDSTVEVHMKDGVYYSMTSSLTDPSNAYGTFINETGVYSLYPGEKRAVYATDSEGLTAETMLGMDAFYSKIQDYAENTEFTEETREVEGVSYSADVYPETEFDPERVFCYTEDGILKYLFSGNVKVGDMDLGETIYILKSIDTAVDESLLSLDGYTVEGLPEGTD